MDKDIGAIIAAILLVLVIAFVASNYNFTGKTTKEVTTRITINPDVVNAGEMLNMEITPGNKGIHKTYYICDARDMCHVNNELRCKSFKCTKPLTASYKTWSSWDGIFYVRVFDYGSREFIKTYFTIVK